MAAAKKELTMYEMSMELATLKGKMNIIIGLLTFVGLANLTIIVETLIRK